MDPYYYKQAPLVRKDLNMTRGKEIAQGAHASMITLLDNREDPRMEAWLDGTFHWTGPASPGFGPADFGRAAITFRGTATEASA